MAQSDKRKSRKSYCRLYKAARREVAGFSVEDSLTHSSSEDELSEDDIYQPSVIPSIPLSAHNDSNHSVLSKVAVPDTKVFKEVRRFCQSGFDFSGRHFIVHVVGLPCDAPARAMVRSSKGYMGAPTPTQAPVTPSSRPRASMVSPSSRNAGPEEMQVSTPTGSSVLERYRTTVILKLNTLLREQGETNRLLQEMKAHLMPPLDEMEAILLDKFKDNMGRGYSDQIRTPLKKPPKD
ncbi:hypothetical protein CAPTEDRAFT_201960 [Capitella teleta]|uniref:Uncharacterized protein n=1 Tax=Capitella teleta TaxID=283909 RepID=R7V4G7_CAPTE|nr:hypothetical protein CAPTEDRAFT_201960 [Capitella teleta]|eukprot:ELU10665.1 hypothetical protein CAPTEDRAFT_201960 [Capitella teleta]